MRNDVDRGNVRVGLGIPAGGRTSLHPPKLAKAQASEKAANYDPCRLFRWAFIRFIEWDLLISVRQAVRPTRLRIMPSRIAV